MNSNYIFDVTGLIKQYRKNKRIIGLTLIGFGIISFITSYLVKDIDNLDKRISEIEKEKTEEGA